MGIKYSIHYTLNVYNNNNITSHYIEQHFDIFVVSPSIDFLFLTSTFFFFLTEYTQVVPPCFAVFFFFRSLQLKSMDKRICRQALA